MIEPILALVFLTFVVLLIAFLRRVRSVQTRTVRLSYYRVFQGAVMPEDVAKGTNAYANLFEIPVLFYAVAILAIVQSYETNMMVMLAWIYVACRAVHAFIHLTYNNVMHRLFAFVAGNMCVIAMWVLLAGHVL